MVPYFVDMMLSYGTLICCMGEISIKIREIYHVVMFLTLFFFIIVNDKWSP